MRKIDRTGWGRTSQTKQTDCIDISRFSEVDSHAKARSGLAIGLGRSYGDSSLNSEGIYWVSENKKGIQIDIEQGFAECESGVTIGELERSAANLGFFPVTVPGTQFVTIGGAIASNIHGKSDHFSGSFGKNVIELKLLDSNGRIRTLYPGGEYDQEFWATIGGMGLTGIITSAKIKLLRIETKYFSVEEKRAKSLSELIEIIDDFDKKYLYTVAWIDLSGKYEGRGIITGANHSKISELPERLKRNSNSNTVSRTISIPDIFPSGIINSFTVRIFNTIWFRKPLKSGLQQFSAFLHPLDSILNWNRIYGKKGFVQYQIQIPFDQRDFLFDILEELKINKVASFLGVLKKLGSTNNRYLSFPSPGWTIAIDIPAGHSNLETILDALDEKVCKIGGRVYLTKDSRLSKENFRKMYPDFENWKKIKYQLDPDNYWQSDQGRRLGLC